MTESFSVPHGAAQVPLTNTDSEDWMEIVGFDTIGTSLLNLMLDVSAVGAVYDRARCLKLRIVRGHRLRLQQFPLMPER